MKLLYYHDSGLYCIQLTVYRKLHTEYIDIAQQDFLIARELGKQE